MLGFSIYATLYFSSCLSRLRTSQTLPPYCRKRLGAKLKQLSRKTSSFLNGRAGCLHRGSRGRRPDDRTRVDGRGGRARYFAGAGAPTARAARARRPRPVLCRGRRPDGPRGRLGTENASPSGTPGIPAASTPARRESRPTWVGTILIPIGTGLPCLFRPLSFSCPQYSCQTNSAFFSARD